MPQKKNRREFLVSIDLPPGATVASMREYIQDSVMSFAGGLPPEDPLFDTDRKSISVRAVPKDRPGNS